MEISPFISVIVPNYNHFEFLQKRIDSILNQNYQNFELILMDDCSTDNSQRILEHYRLYSKVSKVYLSQINSGTPFGLWKTGIELAKGAYVWIAESDDFAHHQFLEKLVPFLRPEVNLVFCKSIDVDCYGQTINDSDFFKKLFPLKWGNSYRNDGLKELEESLQYSNIIRNASSVIFRKPTVFPDEILKMRFCGDWYFWTHLLKTGGFQFVAEPLNYFRHHSRTTRNRLKPSDEYVRFSEIRKTITYIRKLTITSNLDIGKFQWLTNDVLLKSKKIGRLSRFSLFPPLPLFLMKNYYIVWIKFFFKKNR